MTNVDEVISILTKKYQDTFHKPERGDPFKTLVACILSHRTRDQNSEKAVKMLFSVAQTPEEMLNLSLKELNELIRCSGFYRQKTRYIYNVCKEIVEKNGGMVPTTREALLSLTGVGPKTADIVLSYCFGESTIPVDVHVSRVSKRLGLASSKADPEEVRHSLMKKIKDDNITFYDRSILEIGKNYCRKTNPKCEECPLREKCNYVLKQGL